MDDPRRSHVIRYADPFTPGEIAEAHGVWLHTRDGRRVMDFTSGQICATLGHRHPAVEAAIHGSLATVSHLNSWMLSEPVLALSELLAEWSPDPLSKVMLLSTGAESNESALRMAKMATGRFEVVGLTRAWHGLQAGTLSLNLMGARRGYGPLLPGTLAVPAPYAYRCPVRHCDGTCDCTCLEIGFEQVDQVSLGSLAAAIAEPVLSAGGIIVPPPGYLARLRALCDERGMLLILDEAQTGLGRLGARWGYEIDGIVPDLVTVSKTLGAGLPLAATITTEAVEATCYERGFANVTSHVGDPLPAAVGLAVMQTIAGDGLMERAVRLGDHLGARLRELQERHEQIGDVRGRGLLMGIELVTDREAKTPAPELGAAVSERCLECGLSMNIGREPTGRFANCFRMAPPLTITEDEIDLAVEIIDDAFTTVLSRGGAVPATAT